MTKITNSNINLKVLDEMMTRAATAANLRTPEEALEVLRIAMTSKNPNMGTAHGALDYLRMHGHKIELTGPKSDIFETK